MNPIPNSVPVGLQTIMGYGAFLASLIAPIIGTAAGYATVMHVPNWVFPVIGSAILAVTSYGRSNQAAALNTAAAPVQSPAPIVQVATPDTIASAVAMLEQAGYTVTSPSAAPPVNPPLAMPA